MYFSSFYLKRQSFPVFSNISRPHGLKKQQPARNNNSARAAVFDIGCNERILTVHLLHVGDEIEHLVRVADFIVIPGNYLNEGRSQLDTCFLIED